MLPEVDIFVGNYTIIDQEVYDLWIQGYSVSETVSILCQRGVLDNWGANEELLLSDINDQYRTFNMLEKALVTPTKLAEEWTFQMEPAVQKLVIQKYYDFDSIVMREIIGKKLSGRTRKELDEVAEKTGIMLRSCRKYGAIVFIINNRFETTKRRLSYLSFDAFAKCAVFMMNNWTSITAASSNDAHDDSDLDRDFLVHLKDLKVLLDREKEHRNVTLSHLRGKIPDRMCSEVETNFKVYSRALINIGCCLNNSRDLRDFFIDIVEKVIDPCRQARWKLEELELFLKEYLEAGASLDIMSNDQCLASTWDRFMSVMKECICQLYHS